MNARYLEKMNREGESEWVFCLRVEGREGRNGVADRNGRVAESENNTRPFLISMSIFSSECLKVEIKTHPRCKS